ncbi:MAG TPA: DUF128 domain-containing protein [Candidatus Methanoperedenaceae archaeon]|nr:DUF128 domain-containing protein [Candidatus Methanoperedenaceae archaeon]
MMNPEQLVFTSSKIDSLMYSVTLDITRHEGTLITNNSVVREKDLKKALAIFKRTVDSGISVSPFIMIARAGENAGKVGGQRVEKGYVGLATVCSITIDGVLMKRGIPIRPRFGGVVEVVKERPLRFTEVLTYEGSTIDPLEVLMSQELTSVTDMLETGSGKILANLREAPMSTRDVIETALDELISGGFSGVLEVGEPNTDILGVPVERDHLGIALIGGTNFMAAVQEQGIYIKTSAMSSLLDIKKMSHIDEL